MRMRRLVRLVGTHVADGDVGLAVAQIAKVIGGEHLDLYPRLRRPEALEDRGQPVGRPASLAVIVTCPSTAWDWPEAPKETRLNADLFSGKRASSVGDAYDLSTKFAHDLSKLLMPGGGSVPHRSAPAAGSCAIYGKAPGFSGVVAGLFGAPPEWTDGKRPAL